MTSNEQFKLVMPEHVTSLATAGIIFAVEVRAWTGTTRDRTISNEVAVSKKASPEAGSYIRNLLAGDPFHRRLNNHRATVYNWERRIAYPWANKQFYLPYLRIPRMKQEYDVLKKQHTEYLDEFLKNYQAIVSNAAFVQGDMFDRSQYPSVDVVRNKYGMELYISEVPANDFRVQIAHDLAEDFHKSYSRQTQEIVDRILSKQSQQLVSVLESLSHCCEDEITVDKKTGERKVRRRKIYDSTIQKALELCNTFKEFNLTGNPDLEQARASLERVLDGVPAEAIKESDSVREQVKKEVDDILSKFRPVAPVADDVDDDAE